MRHLLASAVLANRARVPTSSPVSPAYLHLLPCLLLAACVGVESAEAALVPTGDDDRPIADLAPVDAFVLDSVVTP